MPQNNKIAASTNKLSVSLLQIDGVDARSLAEIKRKHATECTSYTFCGYEFSLRLNSLLIYPTAIRGGFTVAIIIPFY